MKNTNKKFSLRARLASFKYAFQGLGHVLKAEHNFLIHLAAAIAVIALGVLLHINKAEWLIIILCIGMVLITEILNTAIEWLVDMVSPQRNEKAGKIKDIAAASVLIAALVALAAGIVVFVPYIF
jgi:diacylglycerol kinase